MAIKSFKSNKLKSYYYNNDESGINPNHVKKIGMALDFIDGSHHPKDLKAVYQRKFSEKKGSGKGVYSIEINGNWRITFQIEEDGAVLLDYLDYHGKKIKAN
ncbi:MAG: type II toxin-antitoxin system RelE/ParE family toxin [Colwellia sp.]|nr:type II toxin-antitoxin system RelE/ParE family toxin [Colwellia sp.]MCW8864228.1 type II toxin-antitoxin system RelE/ParE family toxin [Colwellia sp.]MCW9082568.1 type II toxin-antitoxin system RelE/ParE family toxin [Colwellia sp.]